MELDWESVPEGGFVELGWEPTPVGGYYACLLYTSDAADE